MYKVTVTHTRTVNCRRGREWQIIAQVPIEPGETVPMMEKNGVLKNVYGYTPEYESDKTEEYTVFTQLLLDGEFDLHAVIKAINDL